MDIWRGRPAEALPAVHPPGAPVVAHRHLSEGDGHVPRLRVHAECASRGRIQMYTSDQAQEPAVRESQDRFAAWVVPRGENGLQRLGTVSRQADRRVLVSDCEAEEEVDVALEVAENLAATRQAPVTRFAQRGDGGRPVTR